MSFLIMFQLVISEVSRTIGLYLSRKEIEEKNISLLLFFYLLFVLHF